MEFKTFTINSIDHGLEIGDLVFINYKPYKILSFGTSNEFHIRKLKFYERWYYNVKSFVRRVYQYIVEIK